MGSGSIVLDGVGVTGYVRAESGSIIRDRVGITRMGHPVAPYSSLDSGYAVRSTCIAPLGQDLPTEIEDENIPRKNLVSKISQAVNL